jgi:hypothetical protein
LAAPEERVLSATSLPLAAVVVVDTRRTVRVVHLVAAQVAAAAQEAPRGTQMAMTEVAAVVEPEEGQPLPAVAAEPEPLRRLLVRP